MKRIYIAIILLAAAAWLLAGTDGWNISQENNARGFAIPAYQDQTNGQIILVNGIIIDLVNGYWQKDGEPIQKFEIMKDNEWTLLNMGYLSCEMLKYHLFVNKTDGMLQKESKKVVLLFSEQEIIRPTDFKDGAVIKITIVPNEEQVGNCEVIDKESDGYHSRRLIPGDGATIPVK